MVRGKDGATLLNYGPLHKTVEPSRLIAGHIITLKSHNYHILIISHYKFLYVNKQT
jgi:hypothetical protein